MLLAMYTGHERSDTINGITVAGGVCSPAVEPGAKTHEVFGKGGVGVRPCRGAGCPRSLFSSVPKRCGGNAVGMCEVGGIEDWRGYGESCDYWH